MSKPPYPRTPDGRYFVARSRLWRCSDPSLAENERQEWVNALMNARRAVKNARDDEARSQARSAVDEAKRALGERGPVWWGDDAPDENRHHPDNTRYAAWWASLSNAERDAGS